MTHETLLFLRHILGQFSIRVGEPDFRSTALSMVTALDELDKEIAHAGHPDTPAGASPGAADGAVPSAHNTR